MSAGSLAGLLDHDRVDERGQLGAVGAHQGQGDLLDGALEKQDRQVARLGEDLAATGQQLGEGPTDQIGGGVARPLEEGAVDAHDGAVSRLRHVAARRVLVEVLEGGLELGHRR